MNSNVHDVRTDSRHRYHESPFVITYIDNIHIQNSLSKRNKKNKNKWYDNNTHPTTCCSTNVYFLQVAWIEYFKWSLICLSKTSCLYTFCLVLWNYIVILCCVHNIIIDT